MDNREKQVPDKAIDDLLTDPLIRLVMVADHVDPDSLKHELRRVAEARRRHPALNVPLIGSITADLTPEEPDQYRPGVGIVLFNAEGNIFVARRIDQSQRGWQMPQGGIEPGEIPRDAALRELREEIGTDDVEILAESRLWLRYDLPTALIGHAWGGRWRGQQQKWFAMRFHGQESEINLATSHPEFLCWRWAPAEWVPELESVRLG